MILDAAADHDHLSVGVGQSRRPILTFAQDGRISGMKQRMGHRLGGFAHPAEDDFGGDRVKAHDASPVSMIRFPHGSTLHDIPARITVVESNCCTTAGPSN